MGGLDTLAQSIMDEAKQKQAFDPRRAALEAQDNEMRRQYGKPPESEVHRYQGLDGKTFGIVGWKEPEIKVQQQAPGLVNGACSDCGAKWGGVHRIGCAVIRNMTFEQLIEGYLMLRGLAVVPRSWIEADLPGQIMKLREENKHLGAMVAKLARHVTCLGEMVEADRAKAPAQNPEPAPAAAAIAALNRGWKPTV